MRNRTSKKIEKIEVYKSLGMIHYIGDNGDIDPYPMPSRYLQMDEQAINKELLRNNKNIKSSQVIE